MTVLCRLACWRFVTKQKTSPNLVIRPRTASEVDYGDPRGARHERKVLVVSLVRPHPTGNKGTLVGHVTRQPLTCVRLGGIGSYSRKAVLVQEAGVLSSAKVNNQQFNFGDKSKKSKASEERVP